MLQPVSSTIRLAPRSTHLHDYQLDLGNIIWMDPVFRCLADETALASTSRTIPLYRIASRSHDIPQFRQLNNIGIVIVFEERLSLESCCENRLEDPARLFLLPSAQML